MWFQIVFYVVSSSILCGIQLVSIKICGIEKSVALQQWWWGNIIYRPPPLFCLFLQHNWVSPKYCPLIVFLRILFLKVSFTKVLFQFLLRVWLSYLLCLANYVCFCLLPLFFHFINVIVGGPYLSIGKAIFPCI